MSGVFQIIIQSIGEELLHIAMDKVIEAGIEEIKTTQLYEGLKKMPCPINNILFIVDENGIITITKDYKTRT